MLTAVTLVDAPDRPLLLLGPSLGTSIETLWGRCAALLHGNYHVVGWELPGHGRGAPATDDFDLAGLATEVLELADRVRPGATFRYAGDSVGGAVGLQLLLDAPARVESAVLLCTAAKIGESDGWLQRAETVLAAGTEAVVAGSIERWFGPGFTEREPAAAEALLDVLRGTDAESYALVCVALAMFDVRDRLGEIIAPVLAIAGAEDQPTPPDGLKFIAERVRNGRFAALDGVAHLAPAEQPATVASLIDEHFARGRQRPSAGSTRSSRIVRRSPADRAIRSARQMLAQGPPAEPLPAESRPGERTLDETRAAGMTVRRAVLGDEHVDRAVAGTTPFTQDFQDLITAYAWGEIWTRPGLDRRSRSMITLTALIALGHHDELAMHVRAARTNGLTDDEIMEVLLQSAIYCGVPAANTAFRIAQRVLAEL
ncbi:4-carboxymuconolactone decarboxylase [Actinoplanes sp. NPDC026619]